MVTRVFNPSIWEEKKRKFCEIKATLNHRANSRLDSAALPQIETEKRQEKEGREKKFPFTRGRRETLLLCGFTVEL